MVGVDVLSEQRDLAVALGLAVAGFAYDGAAVPAPFGAPGVRDDAVGADVVAAPHYGDECGNAVLVYADRRDVAVGFLAGQQHVDLGVSRCGGGKQLRKSSVRIRARYKVNLAGLEELVLQSLCHTSEYANDDVRIAPALQVELVNAAPDALLCIVSDGTGVGKYDVRLVH